MATVTGLTKERMEEIEAQSIVDGQVTGNDLILTRFDGTTINAGNVRGPVGTPGVSAAELSAAIPTGMVVDYINTTPPTGWLSMIGQTITNGQTLHPALWAVIPASMKSGSNIVMPDTRGRVSVGYWAGGTADFNVIAGVAGSQYHTISVPELPSHQHDMAHNHPSALTDNGGIDHTHTMNHDHPAGITGTENSTHYHAATTNTESNGHVHLSPISGFNYSFSANGDSITAIYAAGTDYAGQTALQIGAWGNTGPINQTHTHEVNVGTQTSGHTHNFDVALYTGSTGGASAHLHQHTFDVPAYSGNTGNTGGGAQFSLLQPYIILLKIIKAV